MRDGANLAITNDLARVVGLIADKHRDCSIEIAWHEGADEREWIVTATNGTDDHPYIVDDEAGTWAPANADDLKRARAQAEECRLQEDSHYGSPAR